MGNSIGDHRCVKIKLCVEMCEKHNCIITKTTGIIAFCLLDAECAGAEKGALKVRIMVSARNYIKWRNEDVTCAAEKWKDPWGNVKIGSRSTPPR